MRKIMFRGLCYDPKKELDKKEWAFGGVLQTNGEFSIIYPDYDESCAVYTNTLSQQTGKNDVNNLPIYEGDIIKALCGELWVVKYLECGFVASCLMHDELQRLYAVGECEIIGNIYENPEIVTKYRPDYFK